MAFNKTTDKNRAHFLRLIIIDEGETIIFFSSSNFNTEFHKRNISNLSIINQYRHRYKSFLTRNIWILLFSTEVVMLLSVLKSMCQFPDHQQWLSCKFHCFGVRIDFNLDLRQMLKIFNYSIFLLSKTRGENTLFKDNFTIPHRYWKS